MNIWVYNFLFSWVMLLWTLKATLSDLYVWMVGRVYAWECCNFYFQLNLKHRPKTWWQKSISLFHNSVGGNGSFFCFVMSTVVVGWLQSSGGSTGCIQLGLGGLGCRAAWRHLECPLGGSSIAAFSSFMWLLRLPHSMAAGF